MPVENAVKNAVPDLELSIDRNLIAVSFSLEHQIKSLLGHSSLSQKRYKHFKEALWELLPGLSDPAQVLNFCHLFLTFNPAETSRKHVLSKSVLHQILSLFSYSASLSRSLLKYPEFVVEIFPVKKETKETVVKRFSNATTTVAPKDRLRWLRKLKIREFIRIAIGDCLKLDSFEETTNKVSLVADHCIRNVLIFTGLSEWSVAVIAMGKWGGNELNYSSDIDLLFVASDMTTLENLSIIHHLVTQAVRLLDQVTEDGFVFRIDNRLRPEGTTGSLVRTVNQYLGHYRKYALGWELQALVKARCGGGDVFVAAEFMKKTRPLVYNSGIAPEIILEQVREMKRKIEDALMTRRKSSANVKLGIGGIRDIEFIIQFLQLHHGRVNPNLRHCNTLVTIQRLFVHRIITMTEKKILEGEYIFLRQLEHCLQISHELPIRQLPKDLVKLNIIGRKMGFSSSPASSSPGEKLIRRYENSIKKTRHIFQYFFDMTINFFKKKKRVREQCPEINPSIIDAHFSRLESDYFLQFSAAEIARHIHLISRLSGSRLCDVDIITKAVGEQHIVIVAHDYMGEFAIICGLLSAYSLNILSGESFTYAKKSSANSASNTESFYRHRRKHYYSPKERSTGDHRDARKIVCVANVKQDQDGHSCEIDWKTFRDELEELVGLLRELRYEEASERSTLKVIDSTKNRTRTSGLMRVLPPIEFNIDNDSDERYTILEIASQDRFMFLFEFANALAIRNYYIGKVEINTEDGKVQDRLFITTQEGKKIVAEKRLYDLTVTITFIKQFSTFLTFAPNPRLALKQFSNFADRFLDAKQQGAIPIIEQQETMENLARILGTSTFLWEDFLRMQYQNLLPLLVDAKKLVRRPSVSDLKRRLRRHLAKYGKFSDKVACLNRFKDREIFRIDLRHLTRRVPHFTDFCAELTDLADVVLSETFRLAIKQTEEILNRPEPGASTLCALGKWGSKEIGYASDIELMFLWNSPRYETYEVVVFYETVARTIARSIKSKLDGIFELDFRLRPGGRNAPLATPFSRFKSYYTEGGSADTYERQSLVRLRTVTGNRQLSKEIRSHRKHYVFGSLPFDLNRVRYLRERQEKELVEPGRINVKFSRGGLVEAEYFIQVLQIRHGSERSDIQCTNTLEAADVLRANAFIKESAFRKFDDGYRFLRAVINGLRIVRGNAKDLVLPYAFSQEFHYLVRRLESFEHPPGMDDAWAYIIQQMENIHELFLSLFE